MSLSLLLKIQQIDMCHNVNKKGNLACATEDQECLSLHVQTSAPRIIQFHVQARSSQDVSHLKSSVSKYHIGDLDTGNSSFQESA